jgi:hypothetical protein
MNKEINVLFGNNEKEDLPAEDVYISGVDEFN